MNYFNAIFINHLNTFPHYDYETVNYFVVYFGSFYLTEEKLEMMTSCTVTEKVEVNNSQ